MSDRYFLDTNIFIYTFDPRTPEKQSICRELIVDALATQNGLISCQVVQEFLNVATRKFKQPLSDKDCLRYLASVLGPLCEIFPSIQLYRDAIEISASWKYAFYDSLIIAGALNAGCTSIYTEDMQHGQTVKDLRIVNPFR